MNPFAPPASLQLREILLQRGLTPDVVVHVGAHEGQELETYMACGFREIVYCEAHAQTFQRLEQHADFWRRWFELFRERFGAALPRITTVPRAITDHVGTVTFHQINHDMCSSILPANDPALETLARVEVPCVTLDALLDELGLAPERVTFVNLDAQGAELQILRGSPRLVAALPVLLTEVNLTTRYEGGPLEPEVHAFLEEQGFTRLLRVHPWPGYPAADALYAK